MGMRFGTQNVRSLYRAGSLKTVARKSRTNYTYPVYRRLDGRRAALNGQKITHFFMDRGMGIISQGQDFSYTRESYQRLAEWSLLVTGSPV
jgi:hypothetical protein